jgi:transcriptional regulator with XRE-family HTH domain
MKPAPDEFINWVKDEMEKRNLGIRDTARLVKVSHPTISEIVTYRQTPSFDTCVALANAFNYNPTAIVKLAGLLTDTQKTQEQDPLLQDLLYTLSRLPPEDQDELLELAKFKLERQSRTKTTLNSHPKPAQT